MNYVQLVQNLYEISDSSSFLNLLNFFLDSISNAKFQRNNDHVSIHAQLALLYIHHIKKLHLLMDVQQIHNHFLHLVLVLMDQIPFFSISIHVYRKHVNHRNISFPLIHRRNHQILI